MSKLARILERIVPGASESADKRNERLRPFKPPVIDGNYPAKPGTRVNPSRNGAEAGDTSTYRGIFPSRNGDPNQP